MLKKILCTLLMTLATSTAMADDWQQSTSPEIQLGIRNKWGGSNYVAVFSITDPNGGVHTTKVTVKASDFGYILFPGTSETYLSPGKYHWRAYVENQEVVGGTFVVEQRGATQKLTIIN